MPTKRYSKNRIEEVRRMLFENPEIYNSRHITELPLGQLIDYESLTLPGKRKLAVLMDRETGLMRIAQARYPRLAAGNRSKSIGRKVEIVAVGLLADHHLTYLWFRSSREKHPTDLINGKPATWLRPDPQVTEFVAQLRADPFMLSNMTAHWGIQKYGYEIEGSE